MFTIVNRHRLCIILSINSSQFQQNNAHTHTHTNIYIYIYIYIYMQAYLDNMQCKLKRIFSEIDEPLDLNENTSTY